jgi:hypothetical protein
MWRTVASARSTRAGTALAAGLALLALALILVLSGSPLVVARANSVPPEQPIVKADGSTTICQDGERVPARVTAARLTLVAVVGPRVHVTVASGGRTFTSGTTGSGWTAGAVTVPLAPLSRPLPSASFCFSLGPSAEAVEVGGAATGLARAARTGFGRILSGRFTIEYMRPGSASWWSSIETVARELGLGHAPSGTWLAAILALAMAGVVLAASWLALRELR